MEKEENKLTKTEKKKIKENYYYSETKRRAEEKIKEIEIFSGQELNKYDKKLITKREGRKVKKEMRIKLLKGFLFGIGASALLTGGVYIGHNVLDSNQNEKAIESLEENIQDNEQDLLINRFEKEGKAFRQELQDSVESSENLRMLAKEEVTPLTTKEKIVNYLKDMCKEDYNQNNETQIKEVINVIKIHGRIGYGDQITYYEDKAKNGDIILRKTTFDDAKMMGVYPITEPEPLLKMLYETEQGERKVEYATLYKGQYVTVYDEKKDEEIYEYSDNTLVNMGKVIDAGIELWDSTTEGNEINTEKQAGLIEAVTEYKTNGTKYEKNPITKSTIRKNEEERE